MSNSVFEGDKHSKLKGRSMPFSGDKAVNLSFILACSTNLLETLIPPAPSLKAVQYICMQYIAQQMDPPPAPESASYWHNVVIDYYCTSFKLSERDIRSLWKGQA